MKTIAWSSKYFLIPLTPFFIGAIVRTLYQGGNFDWKLLSPGELSFSLAMLFLIGLTNATKLPNPSLRETLVSLYTIGMVLFLAMFTLVIYLDTDVQYTLNTFYANTFYSVTNPSNAITLSPEQLTQQIERFDFTRNIVLGLSVPAIIAIFVTARIYNLDEL